MHGVGEKQATPERSEHHIHGMALMPSHSFTAKLGSCKLCKYPDSFVVLGCVWLL